MFTITESDKVLEIGGGDNPQFRPNLDIRPGPNVDIVADLNNPLPIKDGEYSVIFSQYLAEHISWRNIDKFLAELARIMQENGKLYLITANLLEQCRVITELNELDDKHVCMIFGDQNYVGDDWRANAHYCGFSPRSITEKLNKVGFKNVIIRPHPNWRADMIIKAEKITKMENNPATWTKKERQIAYSSDYFSGAKGKFGGYAYEGYWDFPIHWFTARKLFEQAPQSVLELGCARGYILKKFEDIGIPAVGLEVSKHCHQTKAIENIIEWDITEAPWPLPDQSIDLCYSMAVLEHIPEDKLNVIISETNRVCKRALHGVSFDDDDFDKTHVCLRPKEWWNQLFPPNQIIIDKEELEKGPPNPPLGHGDPYIKLNIGSFITMFYHNWINIDILDVSQFAANYSYKFAQHDMTQKFHIPDSTVDLIYSSHAIEHITYIEAEAFLNECYRMMKPGGIIRISTPDMKKLAEEYLSNKLGVYDDINLNAANHDNQSAKLWELITPGHKSIYDENSLVNLMKKCGFINAQKVGFRKSASQQILTETIDMLPTISLIVEAIK